MTSVKDHKFKPTGVIQTASGEAYEFENPDPAAVKLEDIAHALSNMCRFAGHTKRFYSVAEHCVLVSRILEAEGETEAWQKIGLLHDAHEAYVWDCPRPLKPLLGDKFKILAHEADLAIGIALHVGSKLFHNERIKLADNVALVFEANQLMHWGTEHWSEQYKDIQPPPLVTQYDLGLTPEQAKEAFLSRAALLEVGV